MKDLGAQANVFPAPVLIIGTYNEAGEPDAMNVAWGGQCGPKHVAINIGSHASTDNINATGAFTVAIADAKHLVESDYVGIVSQNKDPEKMAKSKLTAVKSQHVNAPVFTEFPVTMECKVISAVPDEATGETRFVGEIVNAVAREDVLNDAGKVDVDKAGVLAFISSDASYHVIGEKAGQAFHDGAVLK